MKFRDAIAIVAPSKLAWYDAQDKDNKFQDEANNLLEEMPRAGSPQDRGSADRYYYRRYSPHYYEYPFGEGESPRIEEDRMTPEQIALYKKGWDNEDERKEFELQEFIVEDEEDEPQAKDDIAMSLID